MTRMCKVYFFCILGATFIEYSMSVNETEHNKRNYLKLEIEDGYIRGIKQKTQEKGSTYYAFLGIPYAKPPVGKLRFEPPERNEKWTGIWDATKDKSQCVQSINPVSGSEDCLYINVYTPNLDGNLSVMVWFYGGAFINGNSSYGQYGPDNLLDYNITFVSFNYRLGIFGYLSTGDLVVPGNAALKDQSFALRWVQRNIKYFGGDADKVTIFGESAGAASVSYQTQSKSSAGLFRGAIMQSGNSLCLWAMNRNARKIAFQTGEALKIDTKNSTTLVEGLKQVNYSILNEVSLVTAVGVTLKNPLAGIMFSPVIEPYYEGAFFYNKSDELLRKGEFNRVPVILGINSNEAAVANDIPAFIRLYFSMYDLDYSLLAPIDLTKNELQKNSAAFAVKLHYFGVLPLAVQTDSVIKFISNDQFNRPTRRAAINMSKHVPVYFYTFSYKGVLGNGANTTFGVGHGEDLGFFFNSPNDPGTKEDQLVRARLIILWTNFAKYGNPTPKEDPLLQNISWKNTGKNRSNLAFLNVSSNLKMQTNPFEAEMEFYDNVYKRHGSPPYDTY